jgi:ribosomal protein S18 acetylase RimI-like enzyme
MVNMNVVKETLTASLKEQILTIFKQHALQQVGMHGIDDELVAFTIYGDSNKIIGCVVVQIFWGQLHIKNLVVAEAYRKQGIGKRLMQHAVEYGKSQGCSFAFVETMSFQAPAFYHKLGFVTEFERTGYVRGLSFYYLKKDLYDAS